MRKRKREVQEGRGKNNEEKRERGEAVCLWVKKQSIVSG